MSQKLAIAISGAVSLGSYEAGVLYEIVEAIRQHNLHPDTTPEERIEIDVLTGASAGGMTAGIAAQKLLFEGRSLEGAYRNHFYMPWVVEADLVGMLQEHLGDNPELSLLSSNFIARIADAYLLTRYQAGIPPERHRHPAAAEAIHLGLALANLNGVDYSVPLTSFRTYSPESQSNDQFIYTRHEDIFHRLVQSPETCDTDEFWRPVVRASLACGAFPFAFRALEVARQYQEAVYRGALPFTEAEGRFTYTDGGLFHNEPLGMAKKYVNQLDPRKREQENRFYLYISPHPKESKANREFHEANSTYANKARRLAGTIFAQSRFQDWIMTSQVNNQVLAFDEQALALREAIRSSKANRQAFDRVAESVLELLHPEPDEPPPPESKETRPRGETRQEALARLRFQFREDLPFFGEDREASETWIKVVLVLESLGRLGSRDEMKVYNITASEAELAGTAISAFGGFMYQPFREYDYDVGRQKGREFLENLRQAASDGGRELGLRRFSFEEPIRPLDHGLREAGLAVVPREVRTAFKKRLLGRLKGVVRQSGFYDWKGRIAWWFAERAAAKHIDAWLGLDQPAAPVRRPGPRGR